MEKLVPLSALGQLISYSDFYTDASIYYKSEKE